MDRAVAFSGFVVCTLAMTGCLSGGGAMGDGLSDETPSDDTRPWYERALRPGDAHDHAEPRDHFNLSSNNVELLGWDPLSSPWYGNYTMPGYSCSANDPSSRDDPTRPKMIYAISYASDIAFTAIDVTDRTAPKWVSEFVLPQAHSDGLAVTDDGNYVVFGSEAMQGGDKAPGNRSLVPGSAFTADPACPGGLVLPSAEAPPNDHVYLVDVSDPYRPTYVDSARVPWAFGPHTMKVGRIGSTEYAFAFVAMGMAINPLHPQPNGNLFFAGAQTSRVYIYEIGPKVTGDFGLTLVGSHSILPTGTLPDATAAHIIHDGWFQKHPLTGEHLLYLAAWDEGVVILNVDDPTSPHEVGRWTDYEALDPYEATGNIHHVVTIEGTWDGRHYTVIGPENFLRPPDDIPTAWTYILDTTDPSAPELVGKWRLPVDPQERWDHSFQFSPHFFRIHDRHLYMAHFHAGAWIIDLSTPDRLRDPQAVAVFVPNQIPDDVYESRRVLNSLPNVVDLEVNEEGAFVIDWQSGIYAIKYHPEWEP